MAFAVGRGFLVPPCSLSTNNNGFKWSIGITTNKPRPAKPCKTRAFVARAQARPTWLPGLDPPPHLDGRYSLIYYIFLIHPLIFIFICFSLICFLVLFSYLVCLGMNSLAGDYGFDPLGLGEDPDSLRWYVQAELVHARFAMLGVAGVLFTDVSISELLRILLNYSFMLLVVV